MGQPGVRKRTCCLLCGRDSIDETQKVRVQDAVVNGCRRGSHASVPCHAAQGEEQAGGRPKADRDMEMELTFQGGLEDLGQRLLSRKQERNARKQDTVWEAYERRRRCGTFFAEACRKTPPRGGFRVSSACTAWRRGSHGHTRGVLQPLGARSWARSQPWLTVSLRRCRISQCHREKRAAAKAQGRRHDSGSEDISEPEVSDGEADNGPGAGADPFFQHEDDPFNDPFFQVPRLPARDCKQQGQV